MKKYYGDEILDDFTEFSTADATVFIDPLDGTKDFTNGNLTAVSILIGLAINGVPKIGIVHHPFKETENNGVGFTIFATQEHGAFKLEYNDQMSQEELKNRKPEYITPYNIDEELKSDFKIRYGSSLTHQTPEMSAASIRLVPCKMVKLGGAGNKVNRIALGETDAYIQPAKGPSLWDLCGPEPIIRALGGLITDWDHKRFVYDEKKNGGTKCRAFFIGKTP